MLCECSWPSLFFLPVAAHTDAQLRKGVSFSLQNSTFPGVNAMAEIAFNTQRIAICGSSCLLDKFQLLIRTYVAMDVRTSRSILTQSLGIIMIFICNIVLP